MQGTLCCGRENVLGSMDMMVLTRANGTVHTTVRAKITLVGADQVRGEYCVLVFGIMQLPSAKSTSPWPALSLQVYAVKLRPTASKDSSVPATFPHLQSHSNCRRRSEVILKCRQLFFNLCLAITSGCCIVSRLIGVEGTPASNASRVYHETAGRKEA